MAGLLVATVGSAVAAALGLGLARPVGVLVAVTVVVAVAVLVLRVWVLAPLEAALSGLAGEPGDQGGAEEDLARIGARIERLRQQRRMSREVLHLSQLGVAIFDDAGRLKELNEATRDLFGVTVDPADLVALEALRSVEVAELVEAALTGESVEQTFPLGRRDLSAHAVPVREGVLLWVEDVSGQREAQRARADFVANVSHELRTPITAVMGYLEAVLQDAHRIPDDILPLLKTVDRNARRLRDLFEDLLRLHRIEARRRELPRSLQLLLPVLQEAVRPAADRAHDRNQGFSLSGPDALQLPVNAEALSAIVSNLARNASAYTPTGGTICVEVVEDGPGARIDVRDTGIGIAPRHRERIFERFYRIDDARSRDVGGTGLGLAIVKHYALASQCRVTVDSEVGSGTTFSVHLPG